MIKQQEYYDRVIERAHRMSPLRLIQQIQISTNELPYHVHAKFAQCTQLVFHLPDYACFVRMNHNERVVEDEHYTDHWAVEVDVQYNDATDLLPSYGNPENDDSADYFADIHWLSRCQNIWSYRGDRYDKNVFGPFFLELAQEIESKLPLISQEAFAELPNLWAPTYTFSGSQRQNYAEQQQAEENCRNLYWSKFGDTSLINQKVKRFY